MDSNQTRSDGTSSDQNPAPSKEGGETRFAKLIPIQSGGEITVYATGKAPAKAADPRKREDEQLTSSKSDALLKHFEEIEDLVKGCCQALQGALRGLPPVEEATIEFGVKAGGKVGVPFVTEGSAEANFKISVTWKGLGKETSGKNGDNG